MARTETDDSCCEHRVDGRVKIEYDDGPMTARFKQACFWSRCSKCRKRILVVDDTGTFAEDEL